MNSQPSSRKNTVLNPLLQLLLLLVPLLLVQLLLKKSLLSTLFLRAPVLQSSKLLRL